MSLWYRYPHFPAGAMISKSSWRATLAAILIITTLLSSFLLFLAQPMIGKYLLPWFDGGSSTWAVALHFCQSVLCIGYVDSHFIGRPEPAQQILVRGSILTVFITSAVIFAQTGSTPIFPPHKFKEFVNEMPIWWLLATLSIGIGIYYYLLNTTTTMIQNWFRLTHPERSPFWLYAVSNTDALAALLSYPFLIEPSLSLRQQRRWTMSRRSFVLLCVMFISLSGTLSCQPILLPVSPTSCVLDFEATVHQGPSTGLSLNGELTLEIEQSGSIRGQLTTMDNLEIRITGQAIGQSLDLLFYVDKDTYIFGTGVAEMAVHHCWGVFGGPFVGPQPGDNGDWLGREKATKR